MTVSPLVALSSAWRRILAALRRLREAEDGR